MQELARNLPFNVRNAPESCRAFPGLAEGGKFTQSTRYGQSSSGRLGVCVNTSAARRALHTSRKLMLVVALAVPTTGFSQIVESPSDQPVEQLLGELQAVESREGPNSRHLIEPLTALGSYWQERGDHLLGHHR